MPQEETIAGATVRYHESGAVDEVCAKLPASVHLEQLSDDTTWLGITQTDGTRVCLLISAQGGKIVQTVFERPRAGTGDPGEHLNYP